MSKKTTIIASIVLFVILAALMVCEIKNPTGGQAILKNLF